MLNDSLDDQNSEVITWRAINSQMPPFASVLFLRLKHKDTAEINFCTGLWDKTTNSFLTWPIQDESFWLWWKVTHWALSEAANKMWFKYAWDAEGKMTTLAPKDRIL